MASDVNREVVADPVFSFEGGGTQTGSWLDIVGKPRIFVWAMGADPKFSCGFCKQTQVRWGLLPP